MLGALLMMMSWCGVVAFWGNSAWAEEMSVLQMQVSPTVMNLELRPGEKVKKTFEVKNTGERTLKFVTDVAPYSVKNDDYVTDFETDTQCTQLSDWVELSQDGGTLEPGESAVITATISVPQDAKNSGQYAAFLVQLVDPDDRGVSAARREGVLVYASVGSEVAKSGKILENKVVGFAFNPPIVATSVVENDGNVHLNATYTLEVKSFFGDNVVYSNADDPVVRTILPETQRTNSVAWEDTPKLGIFKVKQTISFAGESMETEKMVILCPVWLLFIMLLVLICVIFWIISRVGSRKNKDSKFIKEEEE